MVYTKRYSFFLNTIKKIIKVIKLKKKIKSINNIIEKYRDVDLYSLCYW